MDKHSDQHEWNSIPNKYFCHYSTCVPIIIGTALIQLHSPNYQELKHSCWISDIFCKLVKLQAGLEFTGSPRCVGDFRWLWCCTAVVCRGVRFDGGHVRHQTIITLKDNQPQLTKSLQPVLLNHCSIVDYCASCKFVIINSILIYFCIHVVTKQCMPSTLTKNVRVAQAGIKLTILRVLVQCGTYMYYTTLKLCSSF